MAMKLIKLDNGLMMEVEVSQDEIEQISGGHGDEVVEKVQSSMDAIEQNIIRNPLP